MVSPAGATTDDDVIHGLQEPYEAVVIVTTMPMMQGPIAMVEAQPSRYSGPVTMSLPMILVGAPAFRGPPALRSLPCPNLNGRVARRHAKFFRFYAGQN